jgi:endonuclease/exonuclease/phosphatase family metal-dependent hydrolase
MAKSKPKRISVGARVQLKKDPETDGKVLSAAGKATWNVQWNEGKCKGTTVEQSSKSLRLYEVDLDAFKAAEESSSDSDDAEEHTNQTNHPERKRKFDTYAKTFNGKKVTVCPV